MTQQFNITEARELHAKTTHLIDWKTYEHDDRSLKISSGRSTISLVCRDNVGTTEMTANAEWISFAHNNWRAMLDTIERLNGKPVDEQRRKRIIEASELIPLEDGFYRLYLEQGAISAAELRVLATELDRLNEPISADVESYFADQKGGA